MSQSRRLGTALVVMTVALATLAGAGSANAVPKAKLSQPPVKIGIPNDPINPGGLDGLEAGVKAVNAAGGIKGRQVEVDNCSTSSTDPNAAAQCVRNFLSDSNILAVHSRLGFGATTTPILEQGGLACVGCTLAAQADYLSPIVFPTAAAGYQSGIGIPLILTDVLKAKTIGVPFLDSPAGNGLIGLVKKFVTTPEGLPNPVTVPIPVAATDLSSQAAVLTSTDGIAFILTSDLTLRLMKALRQQGYDKPFVVSSGVFDDATLKQNVGPTFPGLYAQSYFNHSSKGFQQFTNEMKKYGGKNPITSDAALGGWLAAHMLADVANKMKGDLTRESIVTAFQNLKGYDTNGLTLKPIDYTEKSTFPAGAALPNIRSSYTGDWVLVYKNGHLVPYTKYTQAIDVTVTATQK
jgi:ABC-type branched-subunit amino acid transport system substrate-binding protein